MIGLTKLTVKGDEFVYNWVTQAQAANLSRNMYIDSNFTSELINSYAWDTTIVFLQECDDRKDKTIPYSRQNSVNNSLANRGTNNEEKMDKICNIFDFASNVKEWTTELYSNTKYPCVHRGGNFYNQEYHTSDRFLYLRLNFLINYINNRI